MSTSPASVIFYMTQSNGRQEPFCHPAAMSGTISCQGELNMMPEHHVPLQATGGKHPRLPGDSCPDHVILSNIEPI